MTQKSLAGGTPSVARDDRGLSHFVFIAVGVAIVVGGLWMLYMADAPYHPSIPVTEDESYTTIGS